MSRDGWLPPGVTDNDVDMSAPDYWEWEDQQRRKDEPETMLNELQEGFRWLATNGCRKEAKALWIEIGIALRWLDRMDK
jgi:hypothetical protein